MDRSIESLETRLRIESWKRTERIVVCRMRVSHESRKNFQLNLSSPDDGHFEYSAVATNKTLSIPALWISCAASRTPPVLPGGPAPASAPSPTFQSVATLRVELIHQPARLLRPAARPEIRFGVSPRARSHIERCQRAIERLAA